MNAIIVTFCVLTAIAITMCQGPGRSDDWMKMADECQKKTNANEEEVKRIIAKKVPKTKEGACFLACTKKSTGSMTADNKANMTAIISSLAHLKDDKEMYDNVVKVFQECKALETPEKDECEAAKKYAACVLPKKDAVIKG